MNDSTRLCDVALVTRLPLASCGSIQPVHYKALDRNSRYRYVQCYFSRPRTLSSADLQTTPIFYQITDRKHSGVGAGVPSM